MLNWLARWFGIRSQRGMRAERQAFERAYAARLRARYDAAQTTPENERHWANADSLSATAANNPGVRWRLRDRARYECGNNGYARGMVGTLALDLVGTGPRLQVTLPQNTRAWGLDPATQQSVWLTPEDASRAVELAWSLWDTASNFPAECRVLDESRNRDGECFGVLVSNPAMLTRTGVCLDMNVIETDQVTSPGMTWVSPYQQDGLVLDEHGNRVEYHVLKQHPGDTWQASGWSFNQVPASQVVHWYQPTRAGQQRGIPEITAALPLFAMLRRYTLATLAAAEVAAMFAGIMKTDQPPENGPDSVDAMELIDLERGALVTLPAGWDASQFKPEQPITGYREFKNEILAEIARGVNMPLGRMLGTNQDANYSSARLDQEIYQRQIRCQRSQFRLRVLDPVFTSWLDEALLVPGLLPQGLPPVVSWQWAWHYEGFESSDPRQDAQADILRLGACLTTLSELYAARGLDWQQALRQRARELQLQAQLGLTNGQSIPPPPPAPTPTAPPAPQESPAAPQAQGVANGQA
jgi:lambda family phage portal protein